MAIRTKCMCCDAMTSTPSPRKWCAECEKEMASVAARITWECNNAPCITPYSCCIDKHCLATGAVKVLPDKWENR